MTYQIYVDYGYTTETLLEEFDDLSDARKWFSRYGLDELDGYNELILCSFKDDGELVEHEIMVEKKTSF